MYLYLEFADEVGSRKCFVERGLEMMNISLNCGEGGVILKKKLVEGVLKISAVSV